jgi:peptide/nickel transport system substrate-binding protein
MILIIGTRPVSIKSWWPLSLPESFSRRQCFSAVMLRGCRLGAVLCAASFGAGCAGPPQHPPGYVVVGLDAAPTALDPRAASDASSALILDLVHRGLTTSDAHGDPEPDLADGWQRPDPTTYRFHLRPAVFQNGAPVTAADVVATFRSLADPAVRARPDPRLDVLSEVAAEDEHTVRFTLRAPSSTFLEATRLAVLPATCAARPDCRVGAGPFRLAQADLDRVVLAAAAAADPAPTVPGVVFVVSPDSVSRALGLARGSIDLVQNGVEPDLLPWLTGAGLDVVATPGSTFHYLGMNLERHDLADARVRRAISHAIDRRLIVEQVLAGRARPAGELFPPEHWAHAGLAADAYDPALARRLLAEAGAGPVRVTIKTSTVEVRRRIGEVIAAMLAAVGIDAEVRPLEWATLYGDVRRGAFDVYALAWVGIEEPDQYYAMLHSAMVPPRGSNRGHYADAEVDALTVAARTMPDRDGRLPLYRRVAEIAQRDVPYVPLWWVDNVVVKNRHLRGFTPTPSGDLRWLAHARWDAAGDRS